MFHVRNFCHFFCCDLFFAVFCRFLLFFFFYFRSEIEEGYGEDKIVLQCRGPAEDRYLSQVMMCFKKDEATGGPGDLVRKETEKYRVSRRDGRPILEKGKVTKETAIFFLSKWSKIGRYPLCRDKMIKVKAFNALFIMHFSLH